MFNKVKRWPTFEGQKKRECSYHQHHGESEREDRYINLKGERWKRVLHLEHKDNAVWVLHIITHKGKSTTEKVNITAAKFECGEEEEFFFRRSSFDDSRNCQFTEETQRYKAETRHLVKTASYVIIISTTTWNWLFYFLLLAVSPCLFSHWPKNPKYLIEKKRNNPAFGGSTKGSLNPRFEGFSTHAPLSLQCEWDTMENNWIYQPRWAYLRYI